MAKTLIFPPGAAPALAPYSPGVKAGGAVYISGMLAMDETGASVGVGDAAAQTRKVLEAVKAVLDQAGGTMADVVYSMIFLKDLEDYAAMNAVYKEFFPSEPPARFCVRADLVRPEFLVEISCVAQL
jgi:aminoacrylate peracid reductase